MGTADNAPKAEQQREEPASREQEQEERIACLEQELQQKEERILRLRADFDNYRKRMQKELSSLLSREKEQMLLKFLEVYENLAAACQAHDDQGLNMVRDQFRRALEEEGVAEIPTVGEPFDVARHHAVATECSPEHREGTVIREIRKGYSLCDRVIKPAYVVVSKGDTHGQSDRD